MARWRIVGAGPDEYRTAGTGYTAWVWHLERAGRLRDVEVRITDAFAQAPPEALRTDVGEDGLTHGLWSVSDVREWDEPPAIIRITPTRVTLVGGRREPAGG